MNEAWLSKYRAWVYGGGFGWQIGAGVTTYVMTAAVPLMIVVGALERERVGRGGDRRRVRTRTRPRGAARRGRHTPAALLAFHRRFDAWGEPVRRAVIGVQLAVAAIGAWIVAPIIVASGVTVAAVLLFAWTCGDLHAGRHEIEPSPERS